MADDLDTINNDIERLGDNATNLQTLSTHALTNGDPAKAQELATQAMLMMGKKAELRAKRRDLVTSSPHWQKLRDHLEDLEHKAESAKADIGKAQDTVETAKAVLSVVGKILTVL